MKDSRGGPASFLSDRHGREVGSGPAPYLQFQSAVLTAAATLGRGRGGGALRERKNPSRHISRWPPVSGAAWGVGDPCCPKARPWGMAAPWESAGWGLSGPWRGRRAPAPTGSHVLPGSPQVLRRVGAGWPAGAGGLAMDHVVPPAARSPGWGQGADSLALMAIRAFPGLLGPQRWLLAQGAGWALLSCRLCGALARGGSVEG